MRCLSFHTEGTISDCLSDVLILSCCPFSEFYPVLKERVNKYFKDNNIVSVLIVLRPYDLACSDIFASLS